ncbi:MAG: glycosyltransferase [Hydrogenobaculum sp.]
MKHKVCVVTVTYGDRFHLLKQVIDASLDEGVNKIIVVDNASSENSRNQLKEYEKNLKDKLKVIYLDENIGSAGGYKRGLEEAYKCEDCEFIWLLDDDNKPENNALKVLLDLWDSLDVENKEEKIALQAFRYKKNSHQLFNKLITIENKTNLNMDIKNSFIGFHIKELHKKVYRHAIKILGLERYASDNVHIKGNSNFGIIPNAMFGGLLLHKNILKNIGYPNKELFLYFDDLDWSHRITKRGGKIYFILDSKIEDIDLSWDEHRETQFSLLGKGDPFKVYYFIRNRVFFELNYLVDNKLVYLINLLVFLILASLLSTKNIKIILKAIKDGYEGRLRKVNFLK